MTQEPSIYKPLLHRDGHPGAAFFGKEDAVVTDMSSIAAGDIRSQFKETCPLFSRSYESALARAKVEALTGNAMKSFFWKNKGNILRIFFAQCPL